MEWQEHPDWWTLWSPTHRVARLYKPEWVEKWGARLNLDSTLPEFVRLDPTLTEGEAKAVVVTLAGSQL